MTGASQVKKPTLRKCIGCMELKEKKALIRLCKCDDGHIVIDTSFKTGGRGAYICKDEVCLQKAFKRKALERSFKMRVSEEDYDRLRSEIEK